MTGAVIIAPGDNKTVIGQAGDVGFILVPRDFVINHKVRAGGLTVGAKTLAVDIMSGSAVAGTTVVFPGNDIAAITETAD